MKRGLGTPSERRFGIGCLIGWLALASAGWLLACTQPQTEASCPGCNVVFVLVDTLRADRLSVYGYERPTSPNLEEFSRGAIVLRNARSQAACTYPSVNSILTSRYPFEFLDQADGGLGIPETIPSLPQLLKRRGYETAAISGSPVVTNTPTSLNPKGGFDRGFDHFEVCKCLGADCIWKHKPHAACINEKATQYLAEREKRGGQAPFFLYLHYMDTHDPYRPPGADYLRFGTPYAGEKGWVARGETQPIHRMLYGDGADSELSEADIQHLSDLYDSEVHYFDSQFAVLLEALEKAGVRDDTIIVVASDHGEELLEHNSIRHCHTLFDTEIHTPLILRVPGLQHLGVRSALAENLDLVPTLLDYLAIDFDPSSFAGSSLRPVIERDESIRELSFSSQGTLRSATGERFKLIFDLEDSGRQVFDLAADPAEARPAKAVPPPEFALLSGQLIRWMEDHEGISSPEAAQRAREISRETEARLRAIGYLE